MPIPGIPRGPRSRAFRAFVAQAKAVRGVRTWREWNGQGPVNEPSVGQMPCVMLRFLGGAVERLAVTGGPAAVGSIDIRTTPLVIVETWTAGNNADDALDLFDAIDAALFPEDPAARERVRAAFAEVGISDWQPTRDVAPETLADYDAASIRSVGAYQLTLDLTQ